MSQSSVTVGSSGIDSLLTTKGDRLPAADRADKPMQSQLGRQNESSNVKAKHFEAARTGSIDRKNVDQAAVTKVIRPAQGGEERNDPAKTGKKTQYPTQNPPDRLHRAGMNSGNPPVEGMQGSVTVVMAHEKEKGHMQNKGHHVTSANSVSASVARPTGSKSTPSITSVPSTTSGSAFTQKGSAELRHSLQSSNQSKPTVSSPEAAVPTDTRGVNAAQPAKGAGSGKQAGDTRKAGAAKGSTSRKKGLSNPERISFNFAAFKKSRVSSRLHPNGYDHGPFTSATESRTVTSTTYSEEQRPVDASNASQAFTQPSTAHVEEEHPELSSTAEEASPPSVVSINKPESSSDTKQRLLSLARMRVPELAYLNSTPTSSSSEVVEKKLKTLTVSQKVEMVQELCNFATIYVLYTPEDDLSSQSNELTTIIVRLEKLCKAVKLTGVSTPTLDNIVRTALAMQENRPEPLRNQEVVISPDLAGELAVKKAALLKSVDGEVDAKESERLSDRSSTSTSQHGSDRRQQHSGLSASNAMERGSFRAAHRTPESSARSAAANNGGGHATKSKKRTSSVPADDDRATKKRHSSDSRGAGPSEGRENTEGRGGNRAEGEPEDRRGRFEGVPIGLRDPLHTRLQGPNSSLEARADALLQIQSLESVVMTYLNTLHAKVTPLATLTQRMDRLEATLSQLSAQLGAFMGMPPPPPPPPPSGASAWPAGEGPSPPESGSSAGGLCRPVPQRAVPPAASYPYLPQSWGSMAEAYANYYYPPRTELKVEDEGATERESEGQTREGFGASEGRPFVEGPSSSMERPFGASTGISLEAAQKALEQADTVHLSAQHRRQSEKRTSETQTDRASGQHACSEASRAGQALPHGQKSKPHKTSAVIQTSSPSYVAQLRQTGQQEQHRYPGVYHGASSHQLH